MTLQLSTAVRNATLDAIETTIGTTPTLEIRTGPVPATCATADAGTVLATMTLPSDFMAAASNGSKVLAGTWQDLVADNPGTAAHFRIKQGATCHLQGTVGMSASDLILDNTSIVAGQQITITAFTITAGDTVPADPLMARREDWGSDLAPGVAVLTAGVDVQGDRIEVQVVGWGRDEEAWVIDYRVLWGDPSGPRLWSDLDGVLNGTYGDLPVRAVAVDTGGHHTKMAYEFCRTRLARRIWAIKGRGGPGIPVWPRRPTRSNKAKIPLFIVGVDAVKDAVYARLKQSEPGPGAIHFPRRLDADYFRQLTAERVVTRFEKGRPIRSWQPKRDGERNEALDTFVYAHAALHGLISMGMRLNEEAEGMGERVARGVTMPPKVIRSSWLA